MKDTVEGLTYLSRFFIHNYSMMQRLMDHIDNVKCEYKNEVRMGRHYIIFKPKIKLKSDITLLYDEKRIISNWDNTLEMYLGRSVYDKNYFTKHEEFEAAMFNLEELFKVFLASYDIKCTYEGLVEDLDDDLTKIKFNYG